MSKSPFLLLFVGNYWKRITTEYIRKENLLFRKVNYWSYFPYAKNAPLSYPSVYPGFKVL